MHINSDQPPRRLAFRRRPGGTGRLGAVFLSATVASFMWTGPALAVPTAGDPSSTGTVTAQVNINAAILLSLGTATFTLTGVPGDQPVLLDAVVMHVLTNNATGYTVTAEPLAAVLSGAAGNPDTIPVGDLSVRESGAGTFQALTAGTPTVVYTQATKSVSSPGDPLSNDYEFNTPIPNVNNDVYSVTIQYIASTNA